MACLIGIDVGTSGTKTLLVDETGRVAAQALAEYPLSQPRPGWSEQNPGHWWRAAISTVRAVVRKARARPADVRGIGLSGQMHGSVFLDADAEVIRPAILWNDQRTASECAEITDRIGGERLLTLTCNPALTGFTAPKILWLRKHEPANYDRVKRILLPKDFIRHRLTGEFATEVSDASGTLLFDVRNRRWSDEVLSALQIDRGLLPASFESPEVSGRLTPAAARALGLAAGTPVVGGGGDQAAGAVGNGIVRTGAVSATLGTSGVVFAFSDRVQTDPLGRAHTFCHAVPGTWHVMGVMLSAGGAFQWYRNRLAADVAEKARRARRDPYDLLCAQAAKAAAGAEGLFFLPYLTGERTPHADPDAKGAWVGLTARHGRPEMIRALLEGITYGMRDSLEIIGGMGIPIAEIRASGGGARSLFWRRIQASVYGRPVVRLAAEEGPAYGVALLAGAGTGVWKSVEEACDATIRRRDETPPVPAWRAAYDRGFPIHQGLYRSLRDDFKAISALVAEGRAGGRRPVAAR